MKSNWVISPAGWVETMRQIDDEHEFWATFQKEHVNYVTSGGTMDVTFVKQLMLHAVENNWVTTADKMMRWSENVGLSENGGMIGVWENAFFHLTSVEMFDAIWASSNGRETDAKKMAWALAWRLRSPNVEVFEKLLGYVSERHPNFDYDELVRTGVGLDKGGHMRGLLPYLSDKQKYDALVQAVERHREEIIDVVYTYETALQVVELFEGEDIPKSIPYGLEYMKAKIQHDELTQHVDGISTHTPNRLSKM